MISILIKEISSHLLIVYPIMSWLDSAIYQDCIFIRSDALKDTILVSLIYVDIVIKFGIFVLLLESYSHIALQLKIYKWEKIMHVLFDCKPFSLIIIKVDLTYPIISILNINIFNILTINNISNKYFYY